MWQEMPTEEYSDDEKGALAMWFASIGNVHIVYII